MVDDNKKIENKKNISIKKFSNLEGKFLLVNVGTPEQPANDAQIHAIQEKLEKFFEDNNINCLAFVTHHAVDMKIIETPENIGN